MKEEYIIKRLIDLKELAWQKSIYTKTDFLNLSQISLFYNNERIICNDKNFYRVWGGAKYCERVMIMFGNEELFGYEEPFPITGIHITPTLSKFSQKLTHRDFLGALINLGIKREVLGDILVHDNEAYVFCIEDIAEFIMSNLSTVKHTSVKCCVTKEIPQDWHNSIEEVRINVASVRIDAVVGEVFGFSRSSAQELIRQKQVFVNSTLCENNSRKLKEGDIISVRGSGKFIYVGLNYLSKKGRSNVTINKFC